jgi:hypothetical protein
MKYILTLITLLLLASPPAHAGWFSWGPEPDPTTEYRKKIVSLENQMSVQSRTMNQWQIAAGSLGIGCVLLLVIGTALGAKTRKHYESGRMGQPATTTLNGRKPQFMGEAPEGDNHTTLAA